MGLAAAHETDLGDVCCLVANGGKADVAPIAQFGSD
jgi:hypothetical protein